MDGNCHAVVYPLEKKRPRTAQVIVTSARLIAFGPHRNTVAAFFVDDIDRVEITQTPCELLVHGASGQTHNLGNFNPLVADNFRATFAASQATGDAARVRIAQDAEQSADAEADSDGQQSPEAEGSAEPDADTEEGADAGQDAGAFLEDSTILGKQPSKTAIEAMRETTMHDESPWLVVGSGTAGVPAAFADRVSPLKVGGWTSMMAGSFGGGRVTTIMFSDITGIEYNSGLSSGVLEILTASFQGTANKDYLTRGENDPWKLSNTLPLGRSDHKRAAPYLDQSAR